MTIRVSYFRSWYWLADAGVCVCVPPKCGSTAFAKSFGAPNINALNARADAEGFGPYRPGEVYGRHPDAPKLLAFRDPVDRFASMWRNWCRDREREDIPAVVTYPIGGMTMDELIDAIEVFPLGNQHWYPQAGYLVPGVELVRHTEILERIGRPSITANVTTARDDDPPVPLERLQRLYAHDFDLWERTGWR